MYIHGALVQLKASRATMTFKAGLTSSRAESSTGFGLVSMEVKEVRSHSGGTYNKNYIISGNVLGNTVLGEMLYMNHRLV